MRELTKSMLKVSWALPLFGVRQMMSVSIPTRANQESVRRSLDAVTQAAQGEMGATLRGIQRAGDQLGSGMIDAAFNLLRLESLDPTPVVPTAAPGRPGPVGPPVGVSATAPATAPATASASTDDSQKGWGPVPP